MATRHNKKWSLAFGGYSVAMLSLVASSSVQAEFCRYGRCEFRPLDYSATTGFGLFFTTFGPFVSTSEATKEGLSKHYVQAVKDDAAAYIATDGDLDGPMLESAWRAHLGLHADFRPSKKEFAHLVLGMSG